MVSNHSPYFLKPPKRNAANYLIFQPEFPVFCMLMVSPPWLPFFPPLALASPFAYHSRVSCHDIPRMESFTVGLTRWTLGGTQYRKKIWQIPKTV